MKEKQGHRAHTQQVRTRDLFLIHCHAFLVFCLALHRQINLPWWDQNQKRWCFSTHYQEQGPSEWLDADQRTLHSPECAPNPRRTGKPHCYTGLPNDCDRPQKVRKITQDSNFDIRSWKIELKDRSKNCTGFPDLRMLPHDLWTQPVTYTPGVRWEAGSTGWCLWCTRVPDSSPEASPSQPCTPYAASQKHFGTCKDVL